LDSCSIDENVSYFTTQNENHTIGKYFDESSDKIYPFLEEDSYDKENKKLKYEKKLSINKIGHALHEKDEIFKKFSYSEKIYNYCRDLGYKKPSLIQSMWIFKSKKIGGEVVPHQDSTFLFSESVIENRIAKNCIGFWFAIDDSTIKNACLWGSPGSHKEGLKNIWKKNDNGMMQFFDLNDINYNESHFIPLEVKKGTLIMFDGHFIHKSFKNESDECRSAYTIHFFDALDKWSDKCWLQRYGIENLSEYFNKI